MDEVRIVVVDDNPTRREQIKSILPEYMLVSTSGYGDNAMKLIKPDNDGNVPDLIILNGDDVKGQGLYTFDWMINKSGNEEVSGIPVVVLCADEFSDRALDFLEVGDVTFYEGVIGENELFDVVTKVLEKDDFAIEPDEPAYEETKSLDRLMGQSVKVTASVPGKKRKVVLDMDTQMQNLEAALLRGQKRAEEIRLVLNAARDGAFDDTDLVSRRHGKKRTEAADNNGAGRSKAAGVSYFAKAKKERGITEPAPKKVEEASDRYSEKTLIDKNIANLIQKAASNPQAAIGAQQTRVAGANQFPQQSTQPQQNVQQRQYVQQPQSAASNQGWANRSMVQNNQNLAGIEAGAANRTRRRLVVVDDNPQVTKSCGMFLSMNYEVESMNSPMEAIDYFVRNTADMLIIDAVMPGMSGKNVVESIRMHPGGATVPVIYLLGNDFQGPKEMLMGNNVVGTVAKPVSWGALAVCVDGFFRGRR